MVTMWPPAGTSASSMVVAEFMPVATCRIPQISLFLDSKCVPGHSKGELMAHPTSQLMRARSGEQEAPCHEALEYT